MAKWIHVYEYEDHTYPTQGKAREALGNHICKRSSHIWRPDALNKKHGEVEICSSCGLIRFLVKNPNSYR